MTKLWPYEVGEKTEDCSNVSRRCRIKASRRRNVAAGSVLGGFLAHFEPIMEDFKAQTRGIEK